MSARPELRPATPLRVPPRNVDAERSVLGALLLDNAQVGLVGKLEADDFYLDAHADLFQAMLHLFAQGAPIDTLTLADELERQGALLRVGGLEMLTSLAASVPTAANVEYYARIVSDHSLKRRLINAGGRLADLGFDDSLEAEGAIADAQREVSQLVDRRRSQSDDVELAVTAAALCADEVLQAELIVPGILPAGSITELSGPVKGGKTTFELAAAKAIVTGGGFLGRKCRQGPVVLISEESRGSLKAALKRAGLADCTDLHVIYGMATKRRPWAETAAAAVALAEQVGAVAIFVDTLSTLAGLPAEAENDSGAAGAAILPLRLGADLGLGVWVNRHDRKGGGPLGESGRGSSAFAGAVDTLFTLRRPDSATSPNVRRLQGVSRFDDCLAELDIEWTEDGYRSLGDPATHAAQSQESALLDGLPVGVADAASSESLAEAVAGLSPRRAKEKLEELYRAGRIRRTGAGKRGDPHRYYAFYPQHQPHGPETPAEFRTDPTYKEESAANPILRFPADGRSQETAGKLPSDSAPEFHAAGVPLKGETPRPQETSPMGLTAADGIVPTGADDTARGSSPPMQRSPAPDAQAAPSAVPAPASPASRDQAQPAGSSRPDAARDALSWDPALTGPSLAARKAAPEPPTKPTSPRRRR